MGPKVGSGSGSTGIRVVGKTAFSGDSFQTMEIDYGGKAFAC